MHAAEYSAEIPPGAFFIKLVTYFEVAVGIRDVTGERYSVACDGKAEDCIFGARVRLRVCAECGKQMIVRVGRPVGPRQHVALGPYFEGDGRVVLR